jgi:hypothetical protein
VPFFCLYAEADNLTHVQIEYGTVVIPGPDLVRVITVLIAVSKRIAARHNIISEAHNLAPSISMAGGMRISLKNSTLTGQG